MVQPVPKGLDVGAWRDALPVAGRYAYLNNAATTPLPLFVADAIAEHNQERGEQADEWFDEWLDDVEETRVAVGRLVGMGPESVAFTKNTGDAIGIVATGMDWQRGDNVVVSDREFPSNYYPWRRLERLGVELRVASSTEPVIPLAEWERWVDDRTRLVACSHVEYGTGVRNDVPGLARIAHASDAWLLVDAIQGLGAVSLPEGADLVACGGHKWLMAPLGVGFLAVRPDLVERIEPAVPGWFSFQDPEDMSLAERPLASTARRLEPGNLNFGGLAGLRAAVEAMPPVEKVEARLAELTQRLVDGLAAAGREVATPVEASQRAGIVSFQHPEPQRVVEAARKARVVVAARGDRVRLSPHFWNVEAEVERAVAACTQA